MRLLHKLLRWGGILIAAILILCAAFIAERLSWLPHTIAPLSGKLEARGLAAPVQIVRDRNDVPHISSTDAYAVYFGLGFVHAQDRLWQMAFYRRALEGRLSELVGASALDIDMVARALDLEGRARDCLSHLSPETLHALQAYADGVNAWVSAHRVNPPPEFSLLMTNFEPWKPEHSVLMLKFMAMDLSDNAVAEVERTRLNALLGEAHAAELFPPPEPGDPITLNEANWDQNALNPLDEGVTGALPNRTSGKTGHSRARRSGAHRRRQMPNLVLPSIDGDQLIDKLVRLRGASNNWVVDGRYTKSGKPLLANDPHLGLSAPGIWYLVHLAFPFGNVAGATIPGIPSVVLGHNGHFAWGLTTAQVDTEDLVVETIDPDNPARYLTPMGSEPFQTREVEIKVRFGGTKRMTLKATRNGPVLPAVFPALVQATPKNAVMALSAVGLSRTDTSMDTGVMLMAAHDIASFDAAMAKFQTPMQNVVYADTGGDIGYMTPALVPVRGANAPAKSLVPAQGRNQDPLWKGYIPSSALPHMLNPPSGRIYTANNKIVPDDYPYFLAGDWPQGYRARRMRELLSNNAPWDIAYMNRMQMDDRSPEAAELVPLLLRAKPAGAREDLVLKQLAKWNYEMAGDRAGPLIYIAWATALQQMITSDELQKLSGEMRALRPQFLIRVLSNTDGMAHWCDDVKTPAAETCDEMSARALSQALDALVERYGADMSTWRWDQAHVARFGHEALGSIPLLGNLFNRSIPMDGGPNSLNRGDMPYAGSQPFADVHGAGLRAIYDLSDLDRSRFIIEIGQSGNPLSPHYDDFMHAWGKGDSFEIPTDQHQYTEGALGTWVLTPKL